MQIRCRVGASGSRFVHRFTRTCVTKPQRPPQILDTYQAGTVEAGWYDWWEKKGFFKPLERDVGHKKFTMILPPPNITGTLHLGHALTATVQDILVRWNRMRGYSCVWVPGTDHAGIATQTVVEKKLFLHEGVTRHEIGREKFIEAVWDWKENHGNIISQQLRRTGASLDWSREYFTMDHERGNAVIYAFNKLYEDGLIYRANRIVNWCPFLRSVISDIEVNFETIEGRKFLNVPVTTQDGKKEISRVEVGVIHYIKYPLEPLVPNSTITKNSELEYLTVATTRPETIIGDTAVAVHPDDPRFKQYHKRNAVNPITGALIPIITDSILVDPALGTGVVKVTPAHDPNDYQCGIRHNLPSINIMNTDGTLNSNCPKEFQNLDRFKARWMIVKKLTEDGHYIEKKPHPMSIGLCSRSGDIIEPLIQPQWFVTCTGLANNAAKAVREGEISVYPSTSKQDWYRWLEQDQRDWCISRQLWWGHQIPAWQIKLIDGREEWIVASNESEALEKISKKYENSQIVSFERDRDVLDTWFSAALLPFSAFGWPDKNEVGNTTNTDVWLNRYYPLSVMETGSDILFFWVARMAMLGIYLTDRYPFKEILLHAMVRDAQGKKMSKSLGNVVDPINVIEGVTLDQLIQEIKNGNLDPSEVERSSQAMKTNFPNGIPECGADALRFTLASYMQQGKNINLDVNRIISSKHFCNKIWQATKYCLGVFTSHHPQLKPTNLFVRLAHASEDALTKDFSEWKQVFPGKYWVMDRWILNKLQITIQNTNNFLENRDFSGSAHAIYSFIWNDFCDIYLEFSKYSLKSENPEVVQTTLNTLFTCLHCFIRLAHPIMPFLTEELWHYIRPYTQDPVSKFRDGENEARTEPDSVMIATYPQYQDFEWTTPTEAAIAENIIGILNAIRSSRKSFNLQKKDLAIATIYTNSENLINAIKSLSIAIKGMTSLKEILIQPLQEGEQQTASSDDSSNQSKRFINGDLVISVVPVQNNIVDIEEEKNQLFREKENLMKLILKLEGQMSGKGYLKAPQEIRDEHRKSKESMEQKLKQLEKQLTELSTQAEK